MMTYKMVGVADENGRTYESKWGTYSKKDGFKLDIDVPGLDLSELKKLLDSLFHEDLWKLKQDRKKMTQEEIEKALGYKIEIIDVTPKDDHMKNMSEVLNKIFDNLY